MKHIYITLSAMFIIILTFSLGIQAQTVIPIGEDEVLIYVKMVDEKKVFVTRHGEELITYELGEDECGDISDDGRYILLSTKQPSALRIVDLPTNEIVFETPWQPNWVPCSASWRGDFIVTKDVNSDDPFSRLYFRLENGSLVAQETPLPAPITYPNFPSFYPGTLQNFILQNPIHHNIYLYEKCLSDVVYQGLYCGSRNMVIYDVSTNQELEVLDGASGNYMRGYVVDTTKFDNRERISNQLVAWSPNGRYLAYFNSLSGLTGGPEYTGKVQIYDLQTDSYVTDNEALSMPNINRRFAWTNNNIFIMWKTGMFTVTSDYGYHDGSTEFVFAHIEEQIFVNGYPRFDVISPQAFSATDGRAIAFIGKELIPDVGESRSHTDLVIMSTETGASTFIDTNVIQIITWRGIEADEEWGE